MNNTTMLVKELREQTGASFLDCKKALLAHDGDLEGATLFLQEKNLHKAAKKAERQTAEGLVIVKENDRAAVLVELNCETDFVGLTPDFKSLVHGIADLVLADAGMTDGGKVKTAVFPTTKQTVQQAIQALIGKLGENMTLGQVARFEPATHAVVHGYVHAGAISGYDQDEGRLGVLVELAFAGETSTSIAHDLALHIASAAPKFVSVDDIPANVLAEQKDQLWAEVAAENKPETIKEKMVAGRLHKFYKQNCLLEQPFLKDDGLTVAEWLKVKGEALETAVTVTRFIRAEIES